MKRFIAVMVALFAVAMFCVGIVSAQDATFEAQSKGSITLTKGALDAVRSAVRDEIAKGVNVNVKPTGLGNINRGIADLQEMVDALQGDVADAQSNLNRGHEDMTATLNRIEQKLDNQKSYFPWWGWALLILALLLALYNRGRDGRDGQPGRDGRNGEDAEIDEFAVRRMVRQVIAEERDAEDPLAVPEDALVTITVGSVGAGGSVSIGDVSVTTNGDDDGSDAVSVTVAKGGRGSAISVGKIEVKTAPIPTDPPSAS